MAQPIPEVQETQPGVMQPQKWRVCTNYWELNKVTQVLPMPQGNILLKQQALCGHQWVSIFDSTAGFYAVEVMEESHPTQHSTSLGEDTLYIVRCLLASQVSQAVLMKSQAVHYMA